MAGKGGNLQPHLGRNRVLGRIEAAKGDPGMHLLLT
jgi:hypothetical protein